MSKDILFIGGDLDGQHFPIAEKLRSFRHLKQDEFTPISVIGTYPAQAALAYEIYTEVSYIIFGHEINIMLFDGLLYAEIEFEERVLNEKFYHETCIGYLRKLSKIKYDVKEKTLKKYKKEMRFFQKIGLWLDQNLLRKIK